MPRAARRFEPRAVLGRVKAKPCGGPEAGPP
jgi:hypothetical protein